VVLRLLRGEKLEEVSREVAWKPPVGCLEDEFLDAGKEGLKGKRAPRGGPKTPRRRAQYRRTHTGERGLEEGGRKKGAQMPPQKRPR